MMPRFRSSAAEPVGEIDARQRRRQTEPGQRVLEMVTRQREAVTRRDRAHRRPVAGGFSGGGFSGGGFSGGGFSGGGSAESRAAGSRCGGDVCRRDKIGRANV